MKKRGNRGAKGTKENNFRKNMVTLGTKTAGIVFGTPHLVLALVNRQLAMAEGIVVSTINWDNRIVRTADMRAMKSTAKIEDMEDFVEDKVSQAKVSFIHTMERIRANKENGFSFDAQQ